MKTLVAELRGSARPPPAPLCPRCVRDRAGAGSARTDRGRRGRAGSRGTVIVKSTAPGTYTTITAVSELDLWVQRARRAGIYAFDVETDGTDEMRARPLGFSLSCEEGKACYIPIRASGVTCIPEETVKQRLAGLLEDPSLRLVGPERQVRLQGACADGACVRRTSTSTP